jgi:pSer/pThr/pTyr-binding forkhead associated (FHA) protein
MIQGLEAILVDEYDDMSFESGFDMTVVPGREENGPSEGEGIFELLLEDVDPIPVPDGSLYIVGRGDEATVVLDDPMVSKHHCMFIRKGLTLEIKDLGSGNGTIVNGIKIQDSELFNGDTIVLGSFLITVRIEMAGQAPAPTRRGLPSFSEILLGGGQWNLEQQFTPSSPAPQPGKPEPVPETVEDNWEDDWEEGSEFVESSNDRVVSYDAAEPIDKSPTPGEVASTIRDCSHLRTTEPIKLGLRKPETRRLGSGEGGRRSPAPAAKPRPKFSGTGLMIHCGRDSFELREGGILLVGRHKDCDFQLRKDLAMISRRHMRLEWPKGKGPRAVDLGSMNGINYNGTKVRETPIAPGDILMLGPIKFFIKPVKPSQLS